MLDKIRQLFRTVVLSFQDATARRLWIVGLVVVLIPVGSYVVRAGMKPAKVNLPDREFLLSFPRQLGPWQGEDQELDPGIFAQTGAEYYLQRVYLDDRHMEIRLHVAVFSDPDEGVYHRPYNCYRGHGWLPVSEKDLPLEVPERPDMKAHLMTWEQAGRKELVAYWYELGDRVLFDRDGMFRARIALRGQETWPALIKVMITTPGTNDPAEDEKRIGEFAQRVCQWMNGTEGKSKYTAESPE
jgi:EpsI family protein